MSALLIGGGVPGCDVMRCHHSLPTPTETKEEGREEEGEEKKEEEERHEEVKDEEGMWEETFKTHHDSKPYGKLINY